MDLLIPSRSPVRFAAIGPQDSVLFSGHFALSGRYHCGCGRRSGATRLLDVHFFPDQEFRARLPYWHDHRLLVELHFDNAEDFLRAAVRESVLLSLREGVVPAVSGRATIRVEGFRASLEGRQPTYAVRFLSMEPLASARTEDALAGLAV